jgi:hypothetical protein
MTFQRFAPLLLALATTTAVTSLPRPAHADAPSNADLRKARAQFQRGIELEQASNWSEALQQFREVGGVRMTPQVRFHIAYCEEQLGRLVTALGGYELALGEADQVGPDFKHEVENAVAGLRARIPKLMIERGTNAEAALVQLDGVDLGASSVGVEVPLDPGPHTVTATAPGYQQFTTTAELKDREVAHVTIDLTPEPTAEPEVKPPVKEVIVVQQAPGPNRTVPYIVGGVGVATLATSGVLFALRQATQSELKKACPDANSCPESNRDTYNRLKAYNVASQVVFAVGLAEVGVAAALIIFEKKPKPQEPEQGALKLEPSAPGALAGMSLDYRF